MPTVQLNTTTDALAFLQRHQAAGLCSDTRKLRSGDAFIAWPGLAVDPRGYVAAALHAGASACLVDAEGLSGFCFDDERIGVFGGLKSAAGELAARFYGEPSRQLDVVAVTGTNGKTSTAWWTAQVLSASGRRCGLIGTLGAGIPFDAAGQLAHGVQPTGYTTPDPVALQSMLRGLVDAGCQACALEASSIGLDEHRIEGLHLRVAQFTNFTRDHLDYHGSMDAYWQAKKRLFGWPGLGAAVVNIDDDHGAGLAQSLGERLSSRAQPDLDVWTLSTHGPARLFARDVAYRMHPDSQGLSFKVCEGQAEYPLDTDLIGAYNVSNLLGVLAAVRAMGVPMPDALRACTELHPVPGRMQRVALPQAGSAALPMVVVDYAHTPDALDHALRALRPVAQARSGQLWCVFGCGGNRDATKRPLMGALAQQGADHVVLTSDNPRNETPSFILAQIQAGTTRHDTVDVIEDRAEAIAYAVSRAAAGDVVLIAGKGHETTQEVAGVKLAFSDVQQAQLALSARLHAYPAGTQT